MAAPYAAQNKELAYAGICDPFAGGNRRRWP